jgi:hypothetical protein
MKSNVIKGVNKFFKSGHMPPAVNEMTIVLIPKKDEPEFLKDFHPISLCNVIYKMVSKCLVNRLRPLLEDIIEPTQSAFNPGRVITDNTLNAFECLNAIKNGNNGCRKIGAYKLDLIRLMIMWLGFSKRCPDVVGLSKYMGAVGDRLYNHCIVLNSLQ